MRTFPSPKIPPALEDTEKDIIMNSKREIGFMKKHMAHVLILEFYEKPSMIVKN